MPVEGVLRRFLRNRNRPGRNPPGAAHSPRAATHTLLNGPVPQRQNDCDSETLPLPGRVHNGVQKEAVYAAVPDHMNERNEVILKECAHPM